MDDELFIHERVSVVALFRAGQQPCYPVKFKRSNGREVSVTELGLSYPANQGKQGVYIFDVTDGGADYRLEFHTTTLAWWLTREADHVS